MKFASLSILILTFSLVLAEVVLRIAGYRPYSPSAGGNKISAEPSPLFCPDSVFGYNYCPGKFTVTLNGTLTYRLSIDTADRVRQLPDSLLAKGDNLPAVHIHGCSFFAGMGVNDNEVLSAHLQRLLGTQHYVVNRAIPGHGMTTQLRQLQQSIVQGRAPLVAVFSLASFHLHRNPGAADYLNRFQVIKDRPMQFLCSELDCDGRVRFFIKDVTPELLPGASQSALLHLLGSMRDRHSSDVDEQFRLQLALIDSAHALAVQHGSVPVFLLITNDEISTRMVQHAQQRGYHLLRSSVDYNNPDYNLMPHDGHPNASAHLTYAREIFAFMGQLGTISSSDKRFHDHVH